MLEIDNQRLYNENDQLKQIHNMGGMMGIMNKLPGMNQIPDNIKGKVNDDKLKEIELVNKARSTPAIEEKDFKPERKQSRQYDTVYSQDIN